VGQGTVITPLDTIAGRTILESVAAIKPKTNLLLTVSYPKAYLYRRIVMAKLFIDINYADQIDIGEIADKAFFSKFHFIRLFKKIYGKTPHQYLVSVRIEKAMEMLRKGRSVTESCLGVGFISLGSFSGRFKQLTGTTPSDYAREQQKRNNGLTHSPLKFIPGCYADRRTNV